MTTNSINTIADEYYRSWISLVRAHVELSSIEYDRESLAHTRSTYGRPPIRTCYRSSNATQSERSRAELHSADELYTQIVQTRAHACAHRSSIRELRKHTIVTTTDLLTGDESRRHSIIFLARWYHMLTEYRLDRSNIPHCHRATHGYRA